jgi:hypothetical protein
LHRYQHRLCGGAPDEQIGADAPGYFALVLGAESRLSTGGWQEQHGGLAGGAISHESGIKGRTRPDGGTAPPPRLLKNPIDFATKITPSSQIEPAVPPLTEVSAAACFLRNTLPKSIKPACD